MPVKRIHLRRIRPSVGSHAIPMQCFIHGHSITARISFVPVPVLVIVIDPRSTLMFKSDNAEILVDVTGDPASGPVRYKDQGKHRGVPHKR